MARLLDQILIIDIEATCWDGPTPSDQEGEIIEIGLATLDIATLKPLEKRSILIKPERSTVSPFCTQLTTLTQKQVDQGISFGAACDLLKKDYHARSRTWASYGDYDRRQFVRQCEARQVANPFGPSHINIKNLFALVYRLSREVGMAQALKHLDIPLEGTHHRGIDDAWNIAHILARLLSDCRMPGTEADML
ncbi:MAG: exonuclease domain-containing protein [Anaerolineae bacterium]|nr:exonuclease domain-containing protein [Anaerolineae bacterium]